jgi:hypothetical protein
MVEQVHGGEIHEAPPVQAGQALGERLIKEARLAREKAEQSPPGAEPEGLHHKAREADVNVMNG